MSIKHADDCNCRDCTTQRNEPVTETCSACRKRRLCKIDVAVSRDALTGRVPTWSPRYCIAECLGLTVTERRAKYDEAQLNRRKEAPPLAWPIIGGPLDGKYAVPADFYRYGSDPGMYAEFATAYVEFNCASGGQRKIGAAPTMIFVFEELLKPMIRGRDR